MSLEGQLRLAKATKVFKVLVMGKKCVLALLLVLFFLGGLVFNFWLKLESQATVSTVAAQELNARKIILLMRYHGAQVARYRDGRWYFLSRHGRWLPLETKEACRHLASRLAQQNVPCL